MQELEELKQSRTNSAPADCETGDKWLERRGELGMLDLIILYEDYSQQELDRLLNGPDEDTGNPLEI